MHIPNFSLLAQFGGELCEEQTQKMRKLRKPDQKTIFLRLWGNAMDLKTHNPQKERLGCLMNVYIKFPFPSSIWRGDRRGTVLFQGQKRGKTFISPLLIDLGSWFSDMLYDFSFSINWLKKKASFAFLAP